MNVAYSRDGRPLNTGGPDRDAYRSQRTLEVRQSGIEGAGDGVFALENIPALRSLGYYRGNLISEETANEISTRDLPGNNYLLRILSDTPPVWVLNDTLMNRKWDDGYRIANPMTHPMYKDDMIIKINSIRNPITHKLSGDPRRQNVLVNEFGVMYTSKPVDAGTELLWNYKWTEDDIENHQTEVKSDGTPYKNRRTETKRQREETNKRQADEREKRAKKRRTNDVPKEERSGSSKEDAIDLT